MGGVLGTKVINLHSFHSGAVVGGFVGTKVIYIASTVGLLWEVLWELR